MTELFIHFMYAECIVWWKKLNPTSLTWKSMGKSTGGGIQSKTLWSCIYCNIYNTHDPDNTVIQMFITLPNQIISNHYVIYFMLLLWRFITFSEKQMTGVLLMTNRSETLLMQDLWRVYLSVKSLKERKTAVRGEKISTAERTSGTLPLWPITLPLGMGWMEFKYCNKVSPWELVKLL